MTSWSYKYDPIKINGYSQIHSLAHNTVKGRPDSGNGARNAVSSNAKV